MSEFASLELCKELYELAPKWLGSADDCVSSSCTHHGYYDNGTFICPKYSLGYLLRKLPTEISGGKWSLKMWKGRHNGLNTDWYTFAYVHINSIFGERFLTEADTPEDACAKLAIELLKQGVLK